MLGQMNDKTLTLAEHLETADDLAIAVHHLQRVIDRIKKHYPKSHKVSRMLESLDYVRPTGPMHNLKNHLSDKWEITASDEDMKEHRRIYARLQERYERLNGTQLKS